ncbi:MAG: glucosidase [Verrucomicrobiales bacterium]|nr:glucosidase [Verrucomicrobiales bacterium]
MESETPERIRLLEDRVRTKNWKRWGSYLPERQWGTVREDYSGHQESWEYFTHDQARSRAYRWGEDGLMGWTDRECRVCFAPALWNGKDSILKERLFGLSGKEGNHGEDVKECYYYLDATPTHSYTKGLYKYPQKKYPYTEIIRQNRGRDKKLGEIELADLEHFKNNNYFDVLQEVAKRSPNDLIWKISITNHSKKAAPIHVLPTIWFRNVWTWGAPHKEYQERPSMEFDSEIGAVRLFHEELGEMLFHSEADHSVSGADWLFTENETNLAKVFGSENKTPFTKDAFHRYLVNNEETAVNPDQEGTKAAACWEFKIPAGETVVIRCRLHPLDEDNGITGLDDFEETMGARIAESDQFYETILPARCDEEDALISRQGYAGLLWTKQFYEFIIEDWIHGDSDEPAPPESRETGRNHDWSHFFARDILSMPDKWEYPWFAAWDTAFHMVPFSKIDPDFAKSQLLLLLREWYMHPNGQLPAYEWNFSDVNPPVHAWAVWRVYKIADLKGNRDLEFLERAFQKLLLNFTWWVNRKDVEGRHVFGGGFLGLDNIGVFDRSRPLPGGGHLNQADGTAWMASYCLLMLSMSLELAKHRPAYEDIASKFFEHFVNITDAINALGGDGLWDDEDGFYYDQLIIDHKNPIPLKVRSLVGLLPLIAVTVLDQETIDSLPGFKKRMDWFLKNRKELAKYVSYCDKGVDSEGGSSLRLLAIPSKKRLRRCLEKLVNEDEFLSPFGIRSLSKIHLEKPFLFKHQNEEYGVSYVPGESDDWMFGGNSNWRGPVWFPVNYLIVEALERYHHFYGDDFKIEAPAGSGNELALDQVADLISERLISIFQKDEAGYRPCFGDGVAKRYSENPTWQNLMLFHEYFHAETGEGLGASHQTGWTSLVVRLIRERAEKLTDHHNL